MYLISSINLFYKLALPKYKEPKWIPPTLNKEIDEFKRIVDENYISNLKSGIIAFNEGKLVELNIKDPRWQNIDNSDSGQDLTINQAKKIAKSYGKNINSILNGFKLGSKMQAPIIMEMPNGDLHNVAGNTRLMICKALGISPKVWWIKHPDLKK